MASRFAPLSCLPFARTSAFTVLGFSASVIAGASVRDAVAALIWGGVLFGGGMTVLLLALRALGGRRGLGSKDVAPLGRGSRFVNFVLDSWRGWALLVVVIVLSARDDPSGPAFLSGYAVGLLLITLPLLALVELARRRLSG